MKWVMGSISIIIATFILMSNANATLVDNQDGTVTQTRNDSSTLMWLKDTNYALTSGYCLIPGNCQQDFDNNGYMSWYEANNLIDYLNSINHLGYNDWRLPSALNSDGSGPCSGRGNCSDSEVGYMYFTELGNTSYGTNKGPFINLYEAVWDSTEYDSSRAWRFNYGTGAQGYVSKNQALTLTTWAVRDIAVVPEPISYILFITGGTFLAGRWYLRKA